MKKRIILLRTAGFVCVLFMLTHLAFQSVLNWNDSLACLSSSDRAIMLTYHYISILLLGYMAVVLLFQAKEILISKLRYSLLGMIILFFIIRITTEFTLFGWSIPDSPVILFMCMLPVFLLVLSILYRPLDHENK